jgi:hypothetical protein
VCLFLPQLAGMKIAFFFRSAIHCHLWPVRLYHVFPLLSHERHVFRRKVIQNKVCVLISSTTFVCNSSHSQWDTIINVHDLHEKYQLLLSYFYQICPSGQILEKKYSDIKFHENQSSGSIIVPCGQTDMMKLMVALRNFSNSSKNAPIFL